MIGVSSSAKFPQLVKCASSEVYFSEEFLAVVRKTLLLFPILTQGAGWTLTTITVSPSSAARMMMSHSSPAFE